MVRGGSKPSAAQKKAATASKKPANATRDAATKLPEDGTVSSELQQRCLDIFRDALNPSSDDSSILQEVKGHLYNREFATAFSEEAYLRVYASRWSPSRALAYLSIFTELAAHITPAAHEKSAVEPGSNGMRVACLGGGAAGEMVGLGAWLSTLFEGTSPAGGQSFHVDLVDVADWSTAIQTLRAGLTTPPELSKYASQAKKDANKSLVSASALDVKFHQLDVLSPESSKREELAGLLEKANLVTFMFTLNELYSTSLPATQALLNRITETMAVGSHLLVVDSPGSYSTVSLNGTEKKYPMQWLLDHTLLSSNGSEREDAKWEKVVEDDSRWFRLSKDLNYPIMLEDMRFQIHLFRRV